MKTRIQQLILALMVCALTAMLCSPNRVIAQVFTIPGLTLSPIAYTNARFSLRINGPTNRVYRVDASSNLVTWTTLSSNITGGALLVTDAAASGFRNRFYRVTASPEIHGPGQEIMALQGLSTTSLVAGKTTGFRFFADELTYTAADRVEATILRPDGSRLVSSLIIPRATPQ